MERLIAYFSMEIAVESGMPTYSGGLGVLAGDTVRTAADMKIPMVAVTLLHRKGYFTQRIDPDGSQREEPVEWQAEKLLKEMSQRASVELEGRTVYVRAWCYRVAGKDGFTVPVYFLDTDLAENSPEDRTLTHTLYGGDARYRLCQEAVFGIGGVRMLRVLGYEGVNRYHMNEGHSSLLTLDLLSAEVRKSGRPMITPGEIEGVRRKCIFTTHTPISAGHDEFPIDLANRVLERPEVDAVRGMFFKDSGTLNMTTLALNLSHYVNGVAKRHGEVASRMLGQPVRAITNGVHAPTWTSPPFQRLYDQRVPGWREDNISLRYALMIPREEIWAAHVEAKRALLHRIKDQAGLEMEEGIFTLGFARRATGYKRADLLLTDAGRLKGIAARTGPLQVIYAGKAHPHDEDGKEMIRRIFRAREGLQPEVRIVYLENYDMDLSGLMTAGCDVWLNTPQPPLEACGTSGMKAALNAVPSLSILDGWWVEGRQEGITGWEIGTVGPEDNPEQDRRERDAASLYEKLEKVVLPLFYQERDRFIDVMRQAAALNGSYFNTQRMMRQYVQEAYFL